MSEHHVVIAGTGRAGTSFLVQFLAACGLETAATESDWHERARAGGESRLDTAADLPYVVKDPWLWTYCRGLNLSRLRIDALLVPVRDLSSAAASRVLQERAAIAATTAVDRENLSVYGGAPGGIVYSLSIVDQARILAVGFHDLLHWAVSNDIRTVLLDFPRIVEDGDYLVSSLWPFLDGHVDRSEAISAFTRLADSGAVRLREKPDGTSTSVGASDAAIDRAGLAMRIGELQAEADAIRDRLAATEVELASARAGQADADERVSQLQAELEETRAVATTTSEQLAAVQATRSWRMTRPLRSVRHRSTM